MLFRSGDWTAQYIAMRALRHPDAFLAADAALHKVLGLQGSVQQRSRAAQNLSQAWAPWRSAVAHLLWHVYKQPL